MDTESLLLLPENNRNRPGVEDRQGRRRGTRCRPLIGIMIGLATGAVVLTVVALMFSQGVLSAFTPMSVEEEPISGHNVAHEELEVALKDPPKGVAKNVILFLGDGMGPTTVTAARILAGQQMGKRGEEHKLSFDKFPYTGLSKTYNVNTQITDSAASATAFLSGVKTNQGTLGVSAAATRGDCASTAGTHVDTILQWSAKAGKSTGVVTTTRVTHATPAASYSHSPERDWESDRQIPASEKSCEDIALQLITRNKDINVIMGGGRSYFVQENYIDPNPDPSFNTSEVTRLDGRNLIEEWIDDKQTRKLNHRYVWNKKDFDSVNVVETDYLLGLFAQGHMDYEIDRDPNQQPSIAEMTEKAIRILQKNEEGFFLLVEGGRIDHGHHDSKASKALNDAIALAKAVNVATQLTDKADTLIVVTADHSHVMNIAGYASRGNPILGISDLYGVPNTERPLDNMPYTTILYGNGPGYNESRQNVTEVDTQHKSYVYQSAVPMDSETHGGEDVAIYASGPQSYLYTGVHEQNFIPIAMAYASCVGPYAEGQKKCAKYQKVWDCTPFCDQLRGNGTNASFKSSIMLIVLGVAWSLIQKKQ